MTRTEQADRLTEQADRLTEQPDGLTQRPDPLTRKSEWSNWTVLAMIVLCFFVIVRFRPFEARWSAGEGKTLPRLRLQPLIGDGRPVTLGDLTGRVVLINFFGTWSSPSRDELPHLAALQKEFRGQPAFKLLAVSCGPPAKEDLETVHENTRALLNQENIDLPIYVDRGRVSRLAVDQVVGLSGYPTTLILDRRGRIRRTWTGFRPGVETEMRQLITRLLDEV